MSELRRIQQNYAAHRKQIAENKLALQKANAALDNLNTQRELNQHTTADQYLYDQKQQALHAQIQALSSKRGTLAEQLEYLSADLQLQLNPVAKIEELDDSFPILMFPLRLETRFKSTGNQQQLWLRVYPDDCNINHKEELLSASELENGKSFWIEIWKAGGIEAEERGAWRALVNSHGTGRAVWIMEQYKPSNEKPIKPDAQHKILVVISNLALNSIEHEAARDYWTSVWLNSASHHLQERALAILKSSVGELRANEIIEQYRPENMADELIADITAQQVSLERLVLPTPDEYVTTQTSWTGAAKVVALPDRFVAITYTGNTKKNIPFEKPVNENLSVSPDPSLTKDQQIQKEENGDLIINDELKWMVDFEKAIEVGMGTKINLTTQEASAGFDKLFVVGVRFSSDEMDGKDQLEQIFTNSFHSKDGFGLVKQGTPSNNTEDDASGYTWMDDADESYDRIFRKAARYEEGYYANRKSDGQKLADSLGIDAGILEQVAHANARDQAEASAMNTALFPATMGYFMDEMMHPLFSDQEIAATKMFFADFVSGRGPLPAIRMGQQPYGILPISVYSKLDFYDRRYSLHSKYETKDPFLVKLHSLLKTLDKTWDSMLPNVAHIGQKGDPHQVLLDVIGLHANSVEFHQRYIQSVQQLYNQLVLQASQVFGRKVELAIAERGKAILKQLGMGQDGKLLPVLQKYLLSRPDRLKGDLIDDLPLSESMPIRPYTTDGKNYIEWLVSSDAEKIRIEDFGDQEAPNTLLYLLLKHALMLSQADAAAQLLVSHRVVDHKNVFFDPDFLHIQKNETGKSKFEHLYSIHTAITGTSGLKLIDHIYRPSVLYETNEAMGLRETLDALGALENLPTARLERLFAEHLDCCNYRIDAWKTGLVQYKLSEQRTIGLKNNEISKGLYLGAYGWLIDVKPEKKTLKDVNLSPTLNGLFNDGSNTPIQTDSNNLGYIHAPSLNQATTAAILRNAYDSNKTSGSGNPFAINLSSDRVRIAEDFLEGMRNGQSLSALLGYQFERGLHDGYAMGYGEVDLFIYPLRKAFPLVADNLKDTQSDLSDSIEALEANNVIDGLKLIQHVQQVSNKTYPFDLSAAYHLPVATTRQAEAIQHQVQKIMEVHDAISDLVIAEQVYQVVQGNFERVSGNADAFSKGNHPPDIEIMNTPRSGVTLTHRMAIQFDTEAVPPVLPNRSFPRAEAEPAVNQWLASIFPNPKDVLCKVVYKSPVKNDIEMVSQEDLGLQAIDLLYVFNLDAEQAMTELDDRISHYIRYTVTKHPKTDIEIQYTVEVDPDDKTKVSFFELSALVKNLRKILIGAKPLSPDAVAVAREEQDPLMDEAQLKARVLSVRDRLKDHKASIDSQISILESIGYKEDFLNFDQLVERTTHAFLNLAMFDNAQTGIGFIHQGVSVIYDRIFSKLNVVIDRWSRKTEDFNAIIAVYDPAGIEEEEFERLKEAERAISSQATFPVPQTLVAYHAIIDHKMTAFSDLLEQLKLLISHEHEELTSYIIEVESLLQQMDHYDIIPFNVEHSKNDLAAEKLMIATLKDDIHLALDNHAVSLSNKIGSVEAYIAEADASLINADQVTALQSAMKKLLGEDALVVPHFKLNGIRANEVQQSYLKSESLLEFVRTNENRMLPVEDWLGGLARVRQKAYNWESASILSQAFNPNGSMDIVPLQFPYQEEDRWLAMKFRDETNKDDKFHVNTDTLLYTAHFAVPFDQFKPQCGVVIDEWTEVVPATEETTGIAFHYDQPNSEPPQTMLLVTPPAFTGNWKWDDIIESMEETLEMAKKRAVEPAQIEQSPYGQFLPATMMAATFHRITMGANLAINNNIYQHIGDLKL